LIDTAFNALPNAVLFAITGILLFLAAFTILIRILPDQLWTRAVREGSISAAVLLAALAISLAWIVAAAVH
jgi:uncharacterized membrane protein YjfL (UPF0719 family)